ncbi:site-specific recombinase XerD [Salsuginibacillus halophilus]|uniref:Site-specific recombinase XerD n=1 Tax=Salsuginibacillus halophilus TaxID=517424 RepID=A0A2P8HYH6_9BACI|nr:site-specific integrase [Salsuginibacillus halophilus]PSL51276.1 site-specific recombinase XerD [Salsuginibacillus halophilus]
MSYPRDFELPPPALQFLDRLHDDGKTNATLRRYAYDLADFYHYLRAAGYDSAVEIPKALTGEETEHFFEHLRHSRNYQLRTLKRIHTVLNQYFLYLREQKEIAINPVAYTSLNEPVWNELTPEQLVSEKEMQQLLESVEGKNGLSERQQQVRPLLAPRNLIMLKLFRYYGLQMQELSQLGRDHINLGQGTLSVGTAHTETREIVLTKSHQRELNTYVNAIPEPVRPKPGRGDPLWVAFDFQRQTYRWNYEADAPKQLSEVAIQKMIREEMKRAGLRSGLTAQHLRHTFIIRELEKGTSPEMLETKLGLQSSLALERHLNYVGAKSQ